MEKDGENPHTHLPPQKRGELRETPPKRERQKHPPKQREGAQTLGGFGGCQGGVQGVSGAFGGGGCQSCPMKLGVAWGGSGGPWGRVGLTGAGLAAPRPLDDALPGVHEPPQFGATPLCRFGVPDAPLSHRHPFLGERRRGGETEAQGEPPSPSPFTNSTSQRTPPTKSPP